MRDIELDSVGILQILEANTTGPPQRLIQEHRAAGDANLDQTLNRPLTIPTVCASYPNIACLNTTSSEHPHNYLCEGDDENKRTSHDLSVDSS